MTIPVQDAASTPTSASTVLSYEAILATLRRVEKLYDAGELKRLHAVPTLRIHTLAEHVYGALVVAAELFRLTRERSVAVIDWGSVASAITLHDAPEVSTGDIPSPTKRAVGSIARRALEELEAQFYREHDFRTPTLCTLEADIVKAADALDLALLCLRERVMGNHHALLRRVFDGACEDAAATQDRVAGVRELRLYMRDVWSAT